MNLNLPTGQSLPGNLPNLDALRAFAVVLVLANHVLETIGAQIGRDFGPYSWHLGRLGVLFFFVHTCFVLMASLERSGADGAPLVRGFYVRRVFRIYPLAIVCIALVVALGVPEAPWKVFHAPGAGALVSNFALTMNVTGTAPVLGPLWTLPIELQMYVALPFIFMLTRRATDLSRVLALLGVLYAIACLLPQYGGRFFGAVFAPCFMAGVVAYSLWPKIAPRVPAAWWMPFLGAAVLVYIGIEEQLEGPFHVTLQTAVCLAIAAALPLVRQSQSRAWNRATRLVARYSYGVYLFHCIALWIGVIWLKPASLWTGLAVSLGLLVALSVASYHALEAPAIRWGERIARRIGAGGATPEPESPAP